MWSEGSPGVHERATDKGKESVTFFIINIFNKSKESHVPNHMLVISYCHHPSIDEVIKTSHFIPLQLHTLSGVFGMKKTPDSSRFCNWLLGIRAAVGQWECDVEAEAVIGGQTGIIRGG